MARKMGEQLVAITTTEYLSIEARIAAARTEGDATGYQRGLERACKAVCEGCREEWPLGQRDQHGHEWHATETVPQGAVLCKSPAIRALIQEGERHG